MKQNGIADKSTTANVINCRKPKLLTSEFASGSPSLEEAQAEVPVAEPDKRDLTAESQPLLTLRSKVKTVCLAIAAICMVIILIFAFMISVKLKNAGNLDDWELDDPDTQTANHACIEREYC